MSTSGKLFTVAPGLPFLKTVADALCDGRLVSGFRYAPDDPLALARVTIFVPTRRAARALRSEFVDRIGKGSAILPIVRPLGETQEDDGYFEEMEGDNLDVLPPIETMDALLELASLVQAWKAALPVSVDRFHGASPLAAPASPADAIWLARGLADLIQSMETEGIAWDRLDRLEAADHAEWWQLTLEFLKIARNFWPARLAELHRSSPAAHREAMLAAEAARLAAKAPHGPVVVAGSTGSLPATAALIAAVATLDQGAVVLPGVDLDMHDEDWLMVRAGEVADGRTKPAAYTHPQYGLLKLLDRLNARRNDVMLLGQSDVKHAARAAAVSQALLPARATASWAGAETPAAAFENLSLIEAVGEREEALAIAVAMRRAAADPAARVALVTPDRNLARRVTVELRRFGIEANDSGGVPLSSSLPATLLRLTLNAVMQPGDPVALTGLLDHPLARFGLTENAARKAAHVVERVALRGTIGEVDIASLSILFKQSAKADTEARHRPDWRSRIAADDLHAGYDLARRVEDAVLPLTGRFVRFDASDEARRLTARAPIALWAEHTARVLEAIARDPETGFAGLWGGEAGEAIAGLFTGLVASRTELTATGAEWTDAVEALIAGMMVKPRHSAHPRVFIWGALEARLQQVDTMILGGLNEGVWPGAGGSDPFLSREMKLEIGLEPPERRTGLAAHDFQMALRAPNVVLSRAVRAGKAPTIASRWVQRLLVVAGEEHATAMRQRGRFHIDGAHRLDERPATPLSARPEPRPPAEAQPKSYSFSEIGTLRRDPFAIYARRVLRLDPMAGLIRDPGVAERGTLYHAILDAFTDDGVDVLDPLAAERLTAIADELFAAENLPSHVATLWRPRFDAIARLFLEWEAKRASGILSRHGEERARIPIGATGVMLTGRADRIDILAGGGAEIIDYKTGTQPTRAQARALLDPQLPLEAAALAAGGFVQLGPVVPQSLKYVRLRPGDVLSVDSLEGGKDDKYRSAQDLGEEAINRLAGFVALLANGRRGFVSRLLPATARSYGGEYDHLARVAEWSSVEGDDASDEGAP